MSDASFSQDDFQSLCDLLATKDKDLAAIIRAYGYPPLWHRPEGFATLVHIILEQQVSLASARAAFDKLKLKIGTITPRKLLALTDTELKDCCFSRQKIIYTCHLALAVSDKELNLPLLPDLPNEDIRASLMVIKGIGHWTVEVYLMTVLHRCDLFPLGDIALVNSLKDVKSLPAMVTKEQIARIAARWKPYRTIAAFLLWHAYINKRNMRIKPYD